MTTGIPLLETRELSKEFRRGASWRSKVVNALDRVDFTMYAGETVGVVGESGSGKTTLARCVLRLVPPTSGKVLFDGVDLATLGREALRRRRREFQYVPQDPLGAMNPGMTIRSILMEPFESHRLGTSDARARSIAELLEAVSLDRSVLERLPGELSGGQQQRVVIARALATGPRLLVADEPVASLDPSVQAQVLNLLIGLRRKGDLALLLVSHSLPVVARLCDRVVVMYRGRIVEEAPGHDFFANARHPYSRLLMECGDLSAGVTTTTAGPARSHPPAPASARPVSGCGFRDRCPEALPECAESAPAPVQIGDVGGRVACFLYTRRTEQS
jgi:oligopeptide/dipeptide ABC transporter ATP-binding protein